MREHRKPVDKVLDSAFGYINAEKRALNRVKYGLSVGKAEVTGVPIVYNDDDTYGRKNNTTYMGAYKKAAANTSKGATPNG